MSEKFWVSLVHWFVCLAIGLAVVTGHYFWADYIGDKREAKVRAQFTAVINSCDTKDTPK